MRSHGQYNNNYSGTTFPRFHGGGFGHRRGLFVNLIAAIFTFGGNRRARLLESVGEFFLIRWVVNIVYIFSWLFIRFLMVWYIGAWAFYGYGPINSTILLWRHIEDAAIVLYNYDWSQFTNTTPLPPR